MGKSKATANDAESCKVQGNKHFSNGKYTEATEWYTKAIEMDGFNHIYFANSKSNIFLTFVGANAYIENGQPELAIEDCDAAIKIEPTFVKVSTECAITILCSHTSGKQWLA
jgi:tetratricopeptide (TPR) repeat protein